MTEGMLSAALELDLLVLFQPTVAVFSAFLVLFLIDFYGSLAKFVGLSRGTQLVDKPSDLGRAMYVDGIGTSVGAVCGTSNIITFVQSLVGIGMGARTGITACVCAGLMFASLGLLPLVGLVPVVAAAGVLIHVGWNLVPLREIRRAGWSRGDITALLLMVVTVAFMYSLDKALLVGFAFHVGQQVFSKERRVDWYLVGSTLLLALSVGLQLSIRGR
jgi:AGZA family xanthine/uracil permease-like MFS transporter